MDRVSSTGLTSANEGNDPVVTARADRERHVSRITATDSNDSVRPPLSLLLDLPFFTICLRLRAGGNDSIYAASRPGNQ